MANECGHTFRDFQPGTDIQHASLDVPLIFVQHQVIKMFFWQRNKAWARTIELVIRRHCRWRDSWLSQSSDTWSHGDGWFEIFGMCHPLLDAKKSCWCSLWPAPSGCHCSCQRPAAGLMDCTEDGQALVQQTDALLSCTGTCSPRMHMYCTVQSMVAHRGTSNILEGSRMSLMTVIYFWPCFLLTLWSFQFLQLGPVGQSHHGKPMMVPSRAAAASWLVLWRHIFRNWIK